MRNVYEVLREKELTMQRVAREIEILRLAAPLLAPDNETNSSADPRYDESESGSNAPPPVLGDETDGSGSAEPEYRDSASSEQPSAWDRLARPWSTPRRPVAS